MNTFFFTWASWKKFFLNFSFEKKMSCIGAVPTSCACPQLIVFAEPVEFGSSWSASSACGMKQKRQDDLSMCWEALVSVWFWLFGRKIRAGRRARGQRLLPDYWHGDDRPVLLSFIMVRTCWLLVTGAKVGSPLGPAVASTFVRSYKEIRGSSKLNKSEEAWSLMCNAICC